MKLNINRQELNECITNVVTKILKEYDFDDFDVFDDDKLDTMVDDPELRDALNNPKAKKAKKSAKKAGKEEMSADEKDDAASEKDEYIAQEPTAGEEDVDFEEGPEDNAEATTDKAAVMIQQAAENETNPLIKRCIEAGVPLKSLYYVSHGMVYPKETDEVNLEWLAKHPNFGRKMDPYSVLDMQINSGEEFNKGLKFKMKGAPISKKTAQAQGKTRPIDQEEEPDPQFN